jgi:flagellin-like protein
MNKRGISPLIATVLLIGFTVVIGILVFGWIRGLTEGTIGTSGTQVETTLKCAGVKVGAVVIDDGIAVVGEGTTPLCGFKYLTNGDDLKQMYADGSGGECIGYGSVSVKCNAGEVIKIIPTIEIEKNIVDCPVQAVSIKC